jgi:hypothetical protein
MKVKSNRLYPYPVLSEQHDDYIDNTFNVDDMVVTDDPYSVSIVCDVVINDKVIKELIADGGIKLFCHIECPVTKYRKAIEVNYRDDGKCEITIPSKDICDTIDICFVLVANRNIENYVNSNLNEIYSGLDITLFKYRTLGYTKTFSYEITKRLDSNGDIPSIFDINKSEDSKVITYDDGGDKIIIYLPAYEYGVYVDTTGSSIRLKQMMTVIPVLAEVLSRIKDNAAEYEEKGWYLVLDNALKKIPGYENGLESEALKTDSTYALAQQIFKEVSNDAFKQFSDLVNRETD